MYKIFNIKSTAIYDFYQASRIIFALTTNQHASSSSKQRDRPYKSML